MFNSCKEFRISENVKNISRFVDNEIYFTEIEERFNIPWRMEVKNTNEYFGFYLKCEKEVSENRKWSIKTDITLKLISCNGKSLARNGKGTFRNSEKRGFPEFISWRELESDYVVDDGIGVEAQVKIIKVTENVINKPIVTDSPCIENKNQKTFLLNHTVKNVSSIKEGGDYLTETENRFNIPWRLLIQIKNEFFGLYLCCQKEQSYIKNWTIEVDYTLKVASVNGQSLSLKGTYTFNKPYCYGREKFIRWGDMLEKYMVNDTIILEARVKIIKMTECEEEICIDDQIL